MSLYDLIIISFILSLDAFALSTSSGATLNNLDLKKSFKMAFSFSFFQGLMPIIGYYSCNNFINYIKNYGNIIVFFILFIIGIKIIYEAYKSEKIKNKKNNTCPFETCTLFLLSIATSIDAFGIGITFSIIGINLILPIILISVITFFMSFLGIYIGNKGKNLFKDKIEFFAGIILILLAFKNLIN